MPRKLAPPSETLCAEDVKFCQLVASGEYSNRDAYLLAYPKFKKYSPKTVNTYLTKYLKLDKIKQEFQRQIELARSDAVMTLQNKLEMLRQVAEDENIKMSDRLKAVELSAKLQKMFADKIELTGDMKHEHGVTPELAAALDKMFS